MQSMQVNQDTMNIISNNNMDLLTWDHFHHQRKSTLTSYLLRTVLGYPLSAWSCPKGPPDLEPTNTIVIKSASYLTRSYSVTGIS